MKTLGLICTLLLLTEKHSEGQNEGQHPHMKDRVAVTTKDTALHSLRRVKRDVCGGDVTSASGVITSPGYPSDYEPNTNCTWKITGSPTERIVLNFTYFEVEKCDGCACDHVQVFTEENGDIIRNYGVFCNDTKPGVLTCEDNNVLVNFKTDHSVQYSGFSATYRKEPCGGVFRERKGKITSPRFPQAYPNNKNCTYEIFAPASHCIRLNFTHFDLESSDACNFDSVQIISTLNNNTVHKYERACGSTAPNNIHCESNKLSIQFTSDGSKVYSGFAAEFDTLHVECTENNGGCKHICEGDNEGNRTCACRTGFVLHPDDHDCKEETSEGKIVHFNSLAQPNGSLVFSWKWRGGFAPSKLSGFYLRATSPNNSSLITLPPTSTSFTADQLRAYTEYDIALWPFYKPEDYSDEKLWKPVTLIVHSPASAPTAPSAVTPWPESEWQRPDEPTLTIYGPVSWNSKPIGYRVRVEPTEDGDHNERIIKLQNQNNYELNVTFSVKPGRKYTVFASACGIGDMGETLVGPETTATIGNISVAPIKLLAKVEIADPTSAVLFWESPSPAERFVITVSLQNVSQGENTDEMNIRPYFKLNASSLILTNESSRSSQEKEMVLEDDTDVAPSNQQLSSSALLRSSGTNLGSATISLDGNRRSPANYSVPLFGLIPNRNYDVHIRACAIDGCNDKLSMTFRTPPSSIPPVTITKILAKDTSSIYVEWSFLRPEEWLEFDLQFQVRAYNNGVFRLTNTTELALTLTNLDSGAEYTVEVRPSLEVAPGWRKYGQPTAAVVNTWPLVPLPPTLSTKGFETAPGVVSVSWVFVNSTVVDVEVATKSTDFVKCTTLSSCEVVVLYGWNSSFKAGFIKISGLKANEAYAIFIRGCNDHGCGSPMGVHVTTGISVPSEPLELHLHTEGNTTAFLSWQPPDEPAGPLAGYLVSWECANGFTMAATTTECSFILPGPLTKFKECSFSVSAYHLAGDGEELDGKPATIATL